MFSFRDAIVTAVILGALPFVLTRPHLGILLWTWIGLMNPHKMTWGFAYNFPFAFIVAIVTIVAILISREPKRLPLAPPMLLLLAFILWMVVTTIFSLYPSFAWPKLDKVLRIQLFIMLTLLVMQSEQRIRALVLVATLSIAFFGIKGGAYTIMRGGGGMVLGPDGGFISGNTEIALALVVTLPLMYWLRQQSTNPWLRRAATVSMALIAVSILGSYSRGGLLALVAIGVFLILKSRHRFFLGIAFALFAGIFFAFMPEQWHAKMGTIENYEDDRSAMGRLGAWRFAWNFAKNHPMIGGGFETFQREQYDIYAPDQRELDPHSIWFQVLAEHGFVGLGLFVLFWVAAWRTGTRVIRLTRKRADLLWARDLAAMIQVALVGFWVGGSFLGLAYWDYPYILVITLVLVRVVVERKLAEAEPQRPAVQATDGRRLGLEGR